MVNKKVKKFFSWWLFPRNYLDSSEDAGAGDSEASSYESDWETEVNAKGEVFYVVPVEEREVDSFNMDRYIDHRSCKDIFYWREGTYSDFIYWLATSTLTKMAQSVSPCFMHPWIDNSGCVQMRGTSFFGTIPPKYLKI